MGPLTLNTLTSTRKVVSRMTQAVPLVLIVEDDTNSLYMMERYTRSSGCEPLCTTSGEKALELAREKQPDVILLDLMLPDLLGWEVLRALRADPLTSQIPVILCTALTVADEALEANAGYLHKPVYYQDFVNALRDEGIEPPKG
jgi:putative two-component system response regulator